MTQSKDQNNITLSLDDNFLDDTDNTISISLNDTYGTTTTYWAGDSVTDIVIDSTNDGTFTITDDATTIDIGDWNLSGDFGAIDSKIDPRRVERMIKHYPALKKVWENFNSMYEMCKQDYEGKIKAGEIDDDDEIPF